MTPDAEKKIKDHYRELIADLSSWATRPEFGATLGQVTERAGVRVASIEAIHQEMKRRFERARSYEIGTLENGYCVKLCWDFLHLLQACVPKVIGRMKRNYALGKKAEQKLSAVNLDPEVARQTRALQELSAQIKLCERRLEKTNLPGEIRKLHDRTIYLKGKYLDQKASLQSYMRSTGLPFGGTKTKKDDPE